MDNDTIERKIDEIISQLTIEEKAAMCRANSKFSSNGVDRLGIDELKMSDGPHGVREEYERHRWIPLNREEDHCTYLPTGSALAATWSKELAFDFGDCLGGEARARGKDIILGPGINIMRNPLCGRNFEYFSEDTCLTSEIAVPLVKGIQKNDVAACVKHYALNNQELNRSKVNVRTSERALFETYLPGFEACVKKGGADCVMGAYNQYFGEHCCHNKYLVKDILKGKFGFDGVYITDWAGCHDLHQAIFNGLDLEMGTSENYDEFYFSEEFVKAAKNDDMALEELNDKVRRILRLMIRINKLSETRSSGEYNTPLHQKIAYNIASEAMVLLKNDNNVLPLNKDKIKTLLVVGENAAAKHALGGNSSYVRALYEVSLLDGIKNRLGDDTKIIYKSGTLNNAKPIKPELMDIVDRKTGCRGFRREAYDNLYCKGKSYETSYIPNPVLSGEPRTKYTYRYYATINILESDTYKLYISGRRGVYLIIDNKRVLRFDADETVTKSYSIKCKKDDRIEIIVEVQPQTPNPVLEIGWSRESEENNTGFDEITEIAKAADAVVFCGGLSHDYDTEGTARKDMKLPKEQNELIEKLLEVRKDTVICLTAGAPVEMPWIDNADTLLWTWYAGMEGGNAFSDILFGKISPSGHLPFTMPYKYEDTPVARYGDYNDTDEYYYDDIYVGYKGYDKDGVRPMFSFGYGMSYSGFEYGAVERDNNTYSLIVKNTGAYYAKTVVQMYIKKIKNGVDFPKKELADFCKIGLKPGEKKIVSFEVKKEHLRYYDEKLNDYSYAESYEIEMGEASDNIFYHEKTIV
ncbi:MAG: glycoside hydrolase family 3 C-terminal domain-containing protein [Clostridia bacterium]|nr:glycoside hydrolase family 3 C-terminal domain-containing protein [Clostridia bacterium]